MPIQNISLKRAARKIRARLLPIKSIIAVYAFGSQALGRTTRFSDLDIGILLNQGALRKAFDFEIKWREELSRMLEGEVDVVILNKADPFLKFQVFQKGIPLLIRDAKRAENYKWQSIREYWDWQPSQRILEGKAWERLEGYPHHG